MRPLVPILMGSPSDREHAREIGAALDCLGVDHEIRVASAHKTPELLLEILDAYEADPRPKVYLTVAGRSNALSGMVDARVISPVIACPPLSSAFAGADIFSSLRMPGGVAPAVVLDPAGAALAAAKILALADPALKGRVAAYQDSVRRKVLEADRELQP